MENHGNKPKKRHGAALLDLLRDFCGYTSWGGLGRVVGTKFVVFKVLWVLIFLAALGMAVFQLIPLFYKYQSRPISTRISLHHNATLDFPSVVFCNLNMIRKSHIPQLPSNIKQVLSEYIGDESIFKESENSSKDSDESYDEDQDEIDPDLLDKVYKKGEQLSVLMAYVEKNLLETIGHQFEDMIFSCTFKGVNCRKFEKYWSYFWHYKYGNCYVFNPFSTKGGNKTKGVHLTASKPGPLYGLSVSMDIEQNEYVDQLSQNAGAAVLISVRGKMPFPYEEGLNVAPGFSTTMGLKMLQINRKDRFDNGSCIKNTAKLDTNIYAKHYNITYSRTACEHSCIARNQMEVCNCLEYKYPGDKGYEYCDILNKTVVSCLKKVAKKARDNRLNCSTCQPLCSDQIFQVTSSFTSWPAFKYEKHLIKEMGSSHKNTTDKNGGLSKNLLKVQIYFQELNFEEIQEAISYQIENFLSDIGGQLGLWLGVSCLSGVEVLELLAFMVLYLLGRKNTVKEENVITMEEGGLVNKSIQDQKV